ncbi:MAG: hypothetical protein ABIP51_13680 [Bacteroidia bacterium]
MKSKFKTFSIIVIIITAFSFTVQYEIGNCYLSFKKQDKLTAASPDRLPETAEKTRTVNTEKGEVEISCIDGYRILYNNEKKAPFVNLKVELSAKDSYEKDQKSLIDNLTYLNSHSANMETKDLIELNFNGYKISGLSRSSIEKGSTLGTFVMFPGKGITVYFYFNNLTPEYRNFESVEDYKKQRDKFIEEYTKYLITCK